MFDIFAIKELINRNTVFNCKTEKIANEFLFEMDKLGYKWGTGTKFTEFNKWEEYREGTCYRVHAGTFEDIDYFLDNDFTVVNVSDYLLSYSIDL